MRPAKATPAAGSVATAGGPGAELARLAGRALDHLEEIGLAILLAAALFPAAPPTASAFTNPTYVNLWSLRIGPTNPFELALALFAGAWLVRALVFPGRSSGFDRALLGVGLALLALEALSLPGSGGEISYLKADLERIALLVAGYLLATRCVRDLGALRTFSLLLATAIALRATELIVQYGLPERTEFATIMGRSALLITEDGLLLMLPVALAWGALVDGRLTLWRQVWTVLGTALVFVVNLLSLRRGAVLMIGATVVARSLGIGGRRLLIAAAALALVVALSALTGPGRTVLDQAGYTVTSSLLQSKDASSSQRRSELENFSRNVDGTEWITGRGIGVLWRAEVASPVDNASFGSKETALTRLGWHVYGLDWAYKFGMLGVLLILLTGAVLGRRAYRAHRAATGTTRWLIYSLGVCVPPLVLLAFTNPRVALFGGVLLGLLSRCCDLSSAAAPERSAVT